MSKKYNPERYLYCFVGTKGFKKDLLKRFNKINDKGEYIKTGRNDLLIISNKHPIGKAISILFQYHIKKRGTSK